MGLNLYLVTILVTFFLATLDVLKEIIRNNLSLIRIEIP